MPCAPCCHCRTQQLCDLQTSLPLLRLAAESRLQTSLPLPHPAAVLLASPTATAAPGSREPPVSPAAHPVPSAALSPGHAVGRGPHHRRARGALVADAAVLQCRHAAGVLHHPVPQGACALVQRLRGGCPTSQHHDAQATIKHEAQMQDALAPLPLHILSCAGCQRGPVQGKFAPPSDLLPVARPPPSLPPPPPPPPPSPLLVARPPPALSLPSSFPLPVA